MRLRRASVALAISVVLHGALLIVLVRRKPAPSQAPPPKPIAVELQFRPPPAPAAPSATSVQPQRAPEERQHLAQKPGKPSRHPVASEMPKSGAGAAPNAPMASAPLKEESPRKVDLMPGIQTWSGFSKAPPAPESHGQTVQNTPEERPDPRAVAEVNAARAKQKVEGWIKDDVAFLRVERGVVDRYFGEMKTALEKAAVNPPKFEAHPIRDYMTDWAKAAQRYGSGGNPYGPDDRATRGRAASPVGRSPQESGRGRAALLAVLEIRQAATGELLSSVLLESSGDKAFDQHVLASARKAIIQLPSPKPGGAGIHSDGLRSAWAFEGRVLYRKKLRDVGKDDWWKAAASAPLSLLGGGSFDETTGDVYVVDLGDPQYTCAVRLLRVY